MTVHPVPSDAPILPHPQQTPPDSAAPYDSTWTEQPADAAPTGLDGVMGQDGKVYVVFAVVLVIWIGLAIFLFRTDRKIDRLERRLDRDISEDA